MCVCVCVRFGGRQIESCLVSGILCVALQMLWQEYHRSKRDMPLVKSGNFRWPFPSKLCSRLFEAVYGTQKMAAKSPRGEEDQYEQEEEEEEEEEEEYGDEDGEDYEECAMEGEDEEEEDVSENTIRRRHKPFRGNSTREQPRRLSGYINPDSIAVDTPESKCFVIGQSVPCTISFKVRKQESGWVPFTCPVVHTRKWIWLRCVMMRLSTDVLVFLFFFDGGRGGGVVTPSLPVFFIVHETTCPFSMMRASS